MPDLLLYQTSDPAFARRAIDALREADIPCYCTGQDFPRTRDLLANICLYIERQADYQVANDIIVKLGAAVDTPIKLPSKRVLFVAIFVVTLIATLVALNWR